MTKIYFRAVYRPGKPWLEGLQVSRFREPLPAALWDWAGWQWASQ